MATSEGRHGSQTSPSPRTGGAATFREVLAQGPTEIPDQGELNAALKYVLPDYEASLLSSRGANTVATAGARNGCNTDGRSSSLRQPAPPHCRGAAAAPDIDGAAAGGPIEPVVADAPVRQHWSLTGLLLAPVWIGVDALQWAGKAVADNAVAPIVRYTSPLGWVSYFFDGLKDMTPQRARDLARIFGNALSNAVGLVQTPGGSKVVAAHAQVVDSFVTAASSPEARQLVIDGAAAFVRIAEALDTPQAKGAVQQVAVVVARLVDVLASRESKIFLQDTANAVCTGFELAHSAEAMVMAAELTANVVHALEMEHNASARRNVDSDGRGRRPIVPPKVAGSGGGCDGGSQPGVAGGNTKEEGVMDYEGAIVESFTRQAMAAAEGGALGLSQPMAGAGVAGLGNQVSGDDAGERGSEEEDGSVSDSGSSDVEGSGDSGDGSDKEAAEAGGQESRPVSQADLDASDGGPLLLRSRQHNASASPPRPCPHAHSEAFIASASPASTPPGGARTNSPSPRSQAASAGDIAAATPASGGSGGSGASPGGAATASAPQRRGAQLPRYTREHFQSVLSGAQATLREQLNAPDAHSIARNFERAFTSEGRRLHKEVADRLPPPRRRSLGNLMACCMLCGFLSSWTLLALYGLRYAVSDVWRLAERVAQRLGVGGGGGVGQIIGGGMGQIMSDTTGRSVSHAAEIHRIPDGACLESSTIALAAAGAA
ncbi:unnamed protein product, partial [Phaeothamnion confervicola]